MNASTEVNLANSFIERELLDRRQIVINGRYMQEITEESLEALREKNAIKPYLFQRGTAMVRLLIGESEAAAEMLSHAALRGELERAALFITADGKGTVKPARPPQDVVADILSLPATEIKLPNLKGIVGCPTYLVDGTLLDRNGYHSPSGLYLAMNGLSGVDTRESLDTGRDLLLTDLLGDFPFADQGSKAHTIAAMLLPFVREFITGPTPLHLIDAPARGTGKGLLADVIAMVTLGCPAYVMTLPHDEAEVDKRITSVLIAGPPIVLLDNVTSLTSSSLSAVLTTKLWRGRRLGKSELVQLPNNALWIATGNNVGLSDELVRRIVSVRLDAKVEQPEMRTGFRHAELVEWTRQHRGELVSAVLSLVREWLNAGRPKGGGTLGRFESWVEVIGGILAVAGIDGFLSNRPGLYAHNDQQTREWLGFVSKWWERYRDFPVTAKDLFEVAKDNGLLLSLWVGHSALSAQQRFGHALSSHRDRIYGTFVIRLSDSPGDTGNLAYYLEERRAATDDLHVERNSETPKTPRTPKGVLPTGGIPGSVSKNSPSETPSPSDSDGGVSDVSDVSEAPRTARKEGRV